uniref:RING-type E3 ubiquitin transferase BRCA1 n=1 Tax=Gasterosteus aculeatus aculeatus TaxID=481459 RepID=G3NSY0_GASAC
MTPQSGCLNLTALLSFRSSQLLMCSDFYFVAFKKSSMKTPTTTDVRKGISVLWETMQCPICLDLMTEPVSTKCDHQFCKFCMMKLLDSTKKNRTNCPVCKTKITKRSLQESPGFQRLVAGLQDMIKAYEHDTGTNYFTGMSQQKGQPGVTEDEPCPDKLLGDTPDNVDSVNNQDPSKSHSSTIAAQNGFAKLMGLEDTSPTMTDVEGLDSGLGEAHPTSSKKISSPTDHLEPLETDISEVVETSTHKNRRKKRLRKLEKPPLPPSLTPDEPEHRPLRMSTRKKLQKDLKPDKVHEEKKKKSLQKVAEWLMTVPTEGSLELDKPNEDTEDSDSCSTASTKDIKIHNSDVNSRREERAKGLEDQVFGAVYKRERRGNKVIAPPLNVLIETPATKETQIISKTRKINTVTPAGFVKETISDDKSESDMEEEQQKTEEVDDASSDVVAKAEQTEVMEEKDKYGEGLNNLPESDQINDKVPCNVSDSGQVDRRRSNRRTCNTLQQVDGDLQAKAKKTENRNMQKPLVLVGVKNGETSPKARPRSEEVQVHIENYPSSEDQEIPTTRSTRRSRRLQLFTQEVQESHKKANLKAVRAEKDRNAPKRSEEANGGNVTPATERNGCVFDQELEGIEDLESSEMPPYSGPTEAVEESAAEVPDAEPLAEANVAPNAAEVPSSSSPADAAVDPTLVNADQDDRRLETVAHVTKCHDDEDKNDSELDTELLLKSFKATKRKSFFFGGPNVKQSRGSDTENPRRADAEDSPPVSAERTDLQALRGDENSPWSDFISPSNSPAQTRKPVLEKPDEETPEASDPESSCSGHGGDSSSRNGVSSGLTPNKVSTRDIKSPRRSVAPRGLHSGLCFGAAEHLEPREPSNYSQSQPGCSARDAGRGKETRGGTSVCSAQHLSNAEGSLTPDGLGIPTSRSGEPTSHSPAESAPRKRKRARRLESSFESGESGEDLPTLTEIFGKSAAPSGTEGRRGSREADGCAGAPAGGTPACPSPDELHSSQASVDLFGTPDECNVPANDVGVSSQFESSQFSSEVLVTQQKVEMQKELVRLEKLMALVSEVLQEKEDIPANEVPSETNPSRQNTDAHRLLPCDQDPGRGSDGEAAPEAERERGRRASERGGAAETAAQRSRPTGPGLNGSAGSKALRSSSASKTSKKDASPTDGQENKENNTPPGDGRRTKMLLVSSGLDQSEQTMVKRFAKRVGARVVSTVTPEVTHIIMHTDEHLVCERTLKYFLGIAGRKWVVGSQWISECFRQKQLLDESAFEVRGDVVNGPDHHGPMRARTREDNNLLMKGYKICFQGPFTDMTTDEMESMVELCGAAVVRDPILLDGNKISHQLVIVQSGSESHSSAPGNATVVTRGWLLDTVATYTLQNYDQYTAPPAGVPVTTSAS